MYVGFRRLMGESSRPALLGAAFALISFSGAVAQDQPNSAASAPTEEIVVTGSRIRTSDVAAASPLSVVTSEFIQKSSVVTLEDLTRKLPVLDNNGAGVGSTINNGSFGAASAGLRNLGYTRTLILMDGKRLPYTNFGASADAVDLNSIPPSLVDHVEILRDSASSIYGADAIGGVVNFITKKNFQGLQTDLTYGSSDKDDSRNYSASVTLGTNFERGNIVVSASYDHRDPILQIDREWASNQFKGTDNIGGGPISSSVPGLIGKIDGVGVYFYGPKNKYVLTSDPNLGSYLRPDVFIVPGRSRGGLVYDLTYHPDLTVGLERKQINLNSHFDITPDIHFIVDGFYTDRTSQQALNPEPLGNAYTTNKWPNGIYLIPALLPDGTANPGNPFGKDISVARTRRFEGGLRSQTDEVQTYRVHAAFEGTIFDNYDWEVGYAYGQSTSVDVQHNTANFTHLQQLAGVLPCGADVAFGCSPANFLGTDTLTPSQVAYAYFTQIRNTSSTQQYAYGSVSGPIYELPAGTMKFATGFEARSETMYDHPDTVTSNGDSSFDTFPGEGSDTNYSAYAEVNIPVLKDLPLVKMLTVDTSARYDYYTLFGRALTWKAGVDYAINDDIRLRGSRSTGFRAPQVKELFGGGFQSAESAVDPCDPSSVPSYAGSARCVSDLTKAGVDPSSFVSGLTGQITGLTGGNRHLKPETSSSWTVGTVFTPSFIPNLSIALDYYDIHIRNTIGTLSVQTIVNDCYGPLNTHCDLVHARQAGTGDITLVDDLEENVGAETTNGLDLEIEYGFGTEMLGLPDGHIQLSSFTEYLLSDDLYNYDPISRNTNITQQAGAFNFSTFAEPRWKSNLSASYSEANWSFGVTERYYGGVHILGAAGESVGQQAAGVFYTDVNFTYSFDNATVGVGIDNLFDKDPPYLGDGAVNTNTNANYDFIGRFLYVKMSAKFGAGDAAPAEAAPYTPPPVQPPAAAPVARSYMVFFDFNKSDLTAEAQTIVDQAAKNAAPAKATTITVTGHTDTVGSDAYNMRLSKRRAESVASRLEADGVPSSEIAIVAKGKRDLLVPTKDGVREPQNRRVTIVYDGGPTS